MSATASWRAWSCTIRLVVEDGGHLPAAVEELRVILDQVDRAASRFRADSALSWANAHAGTPVAVPRILVELVQAALGAAEQTAGAVDPTMGSVLQRWGYDRDIADIFPDGPAVCSTVPTTTWRQVRLHPAMGLLTVPVGAGLDLGATAKAFAADLAARTLQQRFNTAVVVELGGDLAVAGDRAGGWPLVVAEQECGAGQLIMLHRGGLATSTRTVRRWRRGGRVVHHIIDPRTGAPAQGCWRTVSVGAESALAANTASTAAIVLGAEALGWLGKRDLAARLVHTDGHVVTTAGWPTELAAVS